MSALAILVTTIDDEEKARMIADAALDARLVACVQTHQVKSRYVWRGETREETETLLQMKTAPERYAELAALVRRLHSYETPEILRLDASAVDPDYLAWTRAATARE